MRYLHAMASNTSVVRNRITIDGRAYEAKPQGGGRFIVATTSGSAVGGFAVKGRVLEVEDAHIAGADPIVEIALLWARATLSAQEWVTQVAGEPATPSAAVIATPPKEPAPAPAPAPPRAPAAAPAPAPLPVAALVEPTEPAGSKDSSVQRGKSICRIATHAKPEPAAFQKAKAYQVWLRTQPGVQAAYLAHDAQSGKTMSVTIWEDRDKLAALRYASPPTGAVQLQALSVDLLWIVG